MSLINKIKIGDVEYDVLDANYVHTDYNYTQAEKEKIANVESGAETNTIDSISVNNTPQTIDANKNVNIDLSGYQTKVDGSHKLSSDFIDDTLSTNKFVSSQEKSTWSGKQDQLTAGENITIENNVISASGGGGGNLTYIYLNGNGNAAEKKAAFQQAYDCEKSNTPYLMVGKYDNLPFVVQLNSIPSGTTGTMYGLTSPILDDTSQMSSYGVSYYAMRRFQFEIRVNSGVVSNVDMYTLFSSALNSLAQSGYYQPIGIANTTAFTPTSNYNLVHKKYVDDKVNSYNPYFDITFTYDELNDTYSIDKTKAQILAAISGNKVLRIVNDTSTYLCNIVNAEDDFVFISAMFFEVESITMQNLSVVIDGNEIEATVNYVQLKAA